MGKEKYNKAKDYAEDVAEDAKDKYESGKRKAG